jgi:hypothetical protein
VPLTITRKNVLRGSEADFATLANVIYEREGESELWHRVSRVRTDFSMTARNANFRGGKRRLSNRRNLTLSIPERLAMRVLILTLLANHAYSKEA